MLAYSSIAHAGYLLVGLVAASQLGKAAILFYLLAYAVTNLGAFGLMALLSTEERPYEELKDFNGLWHARPGMAALMTVFLLSLGGLPPTAGFVAKWYVFAAAVEDGYIWLAVIGVLSSVVSVFYYLRVVVSMYMSESRAERSLPRVPATAMAGLGLALASVFYLGIIPSSVIDLATRSIATLF
jgi:NADH-quinone oxidoreductase subunit N